MLFDRLVDGLGFILRYQKIWISLVSLLRRSSSFNHLDPFSVLISVWIYCLIKIKTTICFFLASSPAIVRITHEAWVAGSLKYSTCSFFWVFFLLSRNSVRFLLIVLATGLVRTDRAMGCLMTKKKWINPENRAVSWPVRPRIIGLDNVLNTLC